MADWDLVGKACKVIWYNWNRISWIYTQVRKRTVIQQGLHFQKLRVQDLY